MACTENRGGCGSRGRPGWAEAAAPARLELWMAAAVPRSSCLCAWHSLTRGGTLHKGEEEGDEDVA